jgi:hypothetical protein
VRFQQPIKVPHALYPGKLARVFNTAVEATMAKARKRRSAAGRSSLKRKRTARKAARTRKLRVAGRKAAVTRKRRAAARKAAATRKARRGSMPAADVPMFPPF